MDISLITSGIQAALRAAQAGIDLYVERAVDKAIFLPDIRLPKATESDLINDFLNQEAYKAWRTKPPFKYGWASDTLTWHQSSPMELQDCLAKYLEIKAADSLMDAPQANKEQLIGGRMIEQWRQGNQPPTAWSRIALTLTDIGLEFISANPSIMGEQSKGEKLVLAFASNLTVLIPDDVEDMGSRHDFESRLMGIFLRAGLTTLQQDEGNIITDNDVKALVAGVIQPVASTLPSGFSEQFQYRKTMEALLGESAINLFSTLASKPDKYLGEKFREGKLPNAITKGFLSVTVNAAQEGNTNILTTVSNQGANILFSTVLGIAAEQPGLLLGEEQESAQKALFKDLFSTIAGRLKAGIDDNTSDEAEGIAITGMVLETLGKYAPELLKLNPANPWQKVAGSLIEQVLKEIQSAATNNQRFQLLSSAQRYEFGRIILSQIATTPDMLRLENSATQAVVAGMANAMAADDNLLLSNEEWLQIAGAAAAVAADNPARLFNLDADTPPLAVRTITVILNTSGELLEQYPESPMRGRTLSVIIQTVLQALAGDIKQLILDENVLENFFNGLATKIKDSPFEWGSQAIIDYVKTHLIAVLATVE